MASEAGLQPGDRIVSLGGVPLRSFAEVRAALRAIARDDTTTIQLVREGVEFEIDLAVHAKPLEPIAHVRPSEITSRGARLRTWITGDRGAAGILYLQGISNASVELGATPDAPLVQLLDAWTCAGFVTMRLEKRGCGDSEGTPGDFLGDVEDARAALESLRTLTPDVILFGHSVGGMIAPLIARDVRAVIVCGSSAVPWLDCVDASARRQLRLRGWSDDRVEAHVRAERARVESAPDDERIDEHDARWHRQLHAVDLATAWRAVDCPVLALHGEADVVVSEEEARAIATLARDGAFEIVAGLDHAMSRGVDALAARSIEWMRSRAISA